MNVSQPKFLKLRILEWLVFFAVAIPLGSVVYEQAVSAQSTGGKVQGIPRPCRPLETRYAAVPNARPSFKVTLDADVLWAEVLNADDADTVGLKMTEDAAEGFPLPPGQSTVLYTEAPLRSFFVDTSDATAGYAGPALIGVKECE